jgi:hypothetical protein
MKKRIGLLLCALALVAAALVNGPAPAEASACVKPACFASPPCCFASECADWCASRDGGVPACSGGCCSCDTITIEG